MEPQRCASACPWKTKNWREDGKTAFLLKMPLIMQNARSFIILQKIFQIISHYFSCVLNHSFGCCFPFISSTNQFKHFFFTMRQKILWLFSPFIVTARQYVGVHWNTLLTYFSVCSLVVCVFMFEIDDFSSILLRILLLILSHSHTTQYGSHWLCFAIHVLYIQWQKNNMNREKRNIYLWMYAKNE